MLFFHIFHLPIVSTSIGYNRIAFYRIGASIVPHDREFRPFPLTRAVFHGYRLHEVSSSTVPT